MPTWGVHTGLQNTTIDELRALWRRIEDLGFDWISIWDHFYAADLATPECHEAVASHAALACTTERVQVGSLVYCAGYRHPAVLANALATIDHLSGGRAVLGLGAGWAVNEYAAYGIPFPGPGERLDILEESIECIRGLLRQEVTEFRGEHFTLTDAHCEPKPVQDELPIWVGRRRGEAHAGDRGPVGRRVERALRVARAVRPQAPGAARPLRRGRPRPGHDHVHGQRRRRAWTTPPWRPSSATPPRSCAPAC